MAEPDIISMALGSGGSVSRGYLEKLPSSNRESAWKQIFKYFKKSGVPKYSYSERQKRKMFASLCSLQTSSLLLNKILLPNNCCTGLASSYFPHLWNVSCRHFQTAEAAFANDELLNRILDRLMFKMSGRISSGTLRSFLAFSQGVARASNFRPSAAKTIYDYYAKNSVVWDMSCGWGGRLLGAMASPLAKYIGTDPSTQTFDGLQRLAKDMSSRSKTLVEINCCGSEEFVPAEKVSLCFTSPPYFDLEKYSDEPTQSYIKFPTMNKWLYGFLLQTVSNCREALEKSGHLILNVSPKLEEPTIKVCKRAGFRLHEKLQLALTYLPGANREKRSLQKLWKYEPVLVFRKR